MPSTKDSRNFKTAKLFLEASEKYAIYFGIGYILLFISLYGFLWSEMNFATKKDFVDELRRQKPSFGNAKTKFNEGGLYLVNGSLKSKGVNDEYIDASDLLYLIRYQEDFPFDDSKEVQKAAKEASDISFAEQFKGLPLVREILHNGWLEEIALKAELVKNKEHSIEENKLVVKQAVHAGAGDYRLAYKGIRAKEYTILGVIKDGELLPYVRASDGESLGYLIREDRVSEEAFFKHFRGKFQSYSLISSVYSLGLLLVAWCFLLYPYQGNFHAFNTLNRYTRVAPFLLGLPSGLLAFLAVQSRPGNIPYSIFCLLLVLAISFFLVKNFDNKELQSKRRHN